jgi:hypothetical protein
VNEQNGSKKKINKNNLLKLILFSVEFSRETANIDFVAVSLRHRHKGKCLCHTAHTKSDFFFIQGILDFAIQPL